MHIHELSQHYRYTTTTTRRPYTWTPYPVSWIPRPTANYYPIYVPAATTAKPANVAVIDAVLRSTENKGANFLNKHTNSVIGNYHPKYNNRQKDYYEYSPASQVYLKYKRFSPPDDFIIVENRPIQTTTNRPVQVIDIVKTNP